MNIEQIIQKNIDLYRQNQKEKASQNLLEAIEYFGGVDSDNIKTRNKKDQDLYDLMFEFYIFATDGDLRESGRDFGFANVNEIEKELKKIVRESVV